MDHDLLMLIYGVLLGAVSSVITSIITAFFQYWLERREYERRKVEEQRKQVRLIYLPTGEEVRIINAIHDEELKPKLPNGAVEAGSIVFSIVVFGLLLYQRDNQNLALAFTVVPGYLLTKLVIKLIKR